MTTSKESGHAKTNSSISAQSIPKSVPVEMPRSVEVGGRKVSWDELLNTLKKERKQDGGSIQSNRNLSMKDVMSSTPVEQEAQGHIIRAAERLAANEEPKSDPETDSLLKDIASDEITRASKEKDGGMDDAASHVKNNESVLSGEQQGTTTALSRKLKGKARFKSVVKKHMTSNNVEQSLFGLSNALTQMGDEDESGHKHKRKKSDTSDLSSTDRLAHHAVLAGNAAKAKSSKKLMDIESQTQEDTEDELAEGGDDSMNERSETSRSSTSSKGGHHHGFLVDTISENWATFEQFLSPRKAGAKSYARKALLYVMIPSLAIAAILFYLVENPGLCEKEVEETPELDLEPRIEPVFDVNGTVVGNVTITPEEPEREFFVCPGLGASVSWWFLFMGVRQVVTLTLALITQAFVVDFLALSTRYVLSFCGPVVTLFFVQSKGWPFTTTFWAIYDLILLSGDREFSHHWGYWQDWISMFNEENPSGNVVDHEWNTRVLRLVIFVGVATALKRLFVSLFLGRQTFARYGEQLSTVMKDMVLLGEVATLAKDIERFSGDYANTSFQGDRANKMRDLWTAEADTEKTNQAAPQMTPAEAANAFMADRNAKPGQDNSPAVLSNGGPSVGDDEFTRSQQLELGELLDAWEEPQDSEQKEQKHISIGAVLQFRQAMAFMKVRYPFLPAFGLADTREHCIKSAQEVYNRLLLRTPDRAVVPFDTLALLAKDHNDNLDQDKAKLLIKKFRPDRDGTLTKLDFVKSCDSVYKNIRLLSANISNSSQIDSAIENIFNFGFYLIIGAISLAIIGVDPLQLFLSFSSVLVAFAFMFGSSSAQFFQGILFVLVQSPYGVGDRIHLSNPASDTNIDGSSGWVVEKVSLHTTTVYWGATNERATLNNGAISNLRVINLARSPNAQIFVNMKFAIDTPHEKIEVFKAAVEQFLKDRPREWLTFGAFRPTAAEVEKGYINYVTIAQHRSAWQDIGAVLASKAELVTYELEVAKQLDMRYHSPHLPVDLNMVGSPKMDKMAPPSIMDLANNSAPDLTASAQNLNNSGNSGHISPRDYFAQMHGRGGGVQAGGGDE